MHKWNLDVPGGERALEMHVLFIVLVVALNGSFEIGIEELGLISVQTLEPSLKMSTTVH